MGGWVGGKETYNHFLLLGLDLVLLGLGHGGGLLLLLLLELALGHLFQHALADFPAFPTGLGSVQVAVFSSLGGRGRRGIAHGGGGGVEVEDAGEFVCVYVVHWPGFRGHVGGRLESPVCGGVAVVWRGVGGWVGGWVDALLAGGWMASTHR